MSADTLRDWRAALIPADDFRRPTADIYDLAVLGGGTAGLVAAVGAASVGARVALIERDFLGGDCLISGCVPSKALIAIARRIRSSSGPGATPETVRSMALTHVATVQQRLAANDSAARLRGLGIDLFRGEARFVDRRIVEVAETRLRFRKALIATGSRPAIPQIPGLAESAPLTTQSFFPLEQLPESIFILGGGPTGCELAQALTDLGVTTTLLEQDQRVLPHEAPAVSQLIERRLRQSGVNVQTGVELRRVWRNDGVTTIEWTTSGKVGTSASILGAMVVSSAAACLVAAGRRANVDTLRLESAGVQAGRDGIEVNDFGRTSNRHIYAAGDVCSNIRFTHAADAQARAVVRNALFCGRERGMRRVLPRCIYTAPEVARVGLTEDEVHAARPAIHTLALPLSEIDRAVIDGNTDGFMTIHLRRGSDRILGATLVCDYAGELIGEIAFAMERGIGLVGLGQAVRPYPTLGEGVRKLADQYQRQRLTPFAKRALSFWRAIWRRLP